MGRGEQILSEGGETDPGRPHSRFLQLIGDGISRRPQGFVICHAIKKEDKEQP